MPLPKAITCIEVQHEGFAASVTPLQVRNRPPAPLTINLALAGLVSEVTVNGDAPAMVSTDIAENKDAVSADQNLLEHVPVFDQDYVAAMSVFLDSGSIGTSGPQLIVNGVQVTTLAVSSSAIQEVRINQNPYSADMARPGRGSIEIITKDPTRSITARSISFFATPSSMRAIRLPRCAPRNSAASGKAR